MLRDLSRTIIPDCSLHYEDISLYIVAMNPLLRFRMHCSLLENCYSKRHFNNLKLEIWALYRLGAKWRRIGGLSRTGLMMPG